MELRFIGYNRGNNESFELKRRARLVEYVMLVMRSQTFFAFGDKRITANAGAVIIFDKTTPQHFGANGESFLHDWVTFDLTEQERRGLMGLGIAFDRVLYPDNVFALSELIRVLQQEKYSHGECDGRVTSLYLQILFIKLADGISRDKTQKNCRGVDLGKIRASIYSNPTVRRSVQDLAKELNISSSYFLHLYKERFATSPIADIVRSRMEYAEYLLLCTDQSVGQIADELGYSSDVQFIQQFRKFTGQTPGKYRNALR